MKYAVVASWFLTLAACGSAQIHPETATVTPNKVIDMKANWVKDKSKKWDIELAMTNKSEKDIIIMLSDLQCSRGNTNGMLHHTFFNTGERTIDFHKSQTKIFRLVCDTGTPTEGDFKIVINRIYDNPSADGTTKGKVVGDRITWSYSKTN